MRFRVRTRRQPVINIISMIDILCILVIFFIVTTVFKKEEPAVKIDLPESKQAQGTTTEQPVILYVTDSDQLYLDKNPVTVQDLESTLKAQLTAKPDLKIALKADKKATFGFVMKVTDAAKSAGFKQMPAYTQEAGKSP
jgi:biopolymer transport protein ExbD